MSLRVSKVIISGVWTGLAGGNIYWSCLLGQLRLLVTKSCHQGAGQQLWVGMQGCTALGAPPPLPALTVTSSQLCGPGSRAGGGVSLSAGHRATGTSAEELAGVWVKGWERDNGDWDGDAGVWNGGCRGWDRGVEGCWMQGARCRVQTLGC